jgi:hypothetical protein
MTTITGSGLGSTPIRTFDLLNKIVTILGGTKMAFWPFLSDGSSSTDGEIFPYGAGNDGAVILASDAAQTIALWAEFAPMTLAGGTFAYYIDSSANNHLAGTGIAAYSHGNGTADTAVSWGAWIMPTEALGTQRAIIAKYGATANAEEYKFYFDTSGNLGLELHDASASTKEVAVGASDVIVPWAWNFVVATYDGAQAAPDVHLYRNGADQNAAGATTETGAYVAMEDTASILMIGASDATGTPAEEFEGYIALPFITGKELTAAEVTTLYGIGQTLIGL